MFIKTRDDKTVVLGKLVSNDLDKLFNYLQQLSAETKRRFGPHAFDQLSINDFYSKDEHNIGYVAKEFETGKIVAYAIIRPGYLSEDGKRLQSCDIIPNSQTDCTFAPSVADAWQSCGIGNALFRYILNDLKKTGFKRIILWAGVQNDNKKAVNYYLRNGFKKIGQFQHNGLNDDMILEIG